MSYLFFCNVLKNTMFSSHVKNILKLIWKSGQPKWMPITDTFIVRQSKLYGGKYRTNMGWRFNIALRDSCEASKHYNRALTIAIKWIHLKYGLFN